MTSDKTKIVELVNVVDERQPGPEAIVLSVSERFGIVPQSELFNKEIATLDKKKYRRVKHGDIAFNPYLLWNKAIGSCFIKDGGCVSPAYTVLRPKYEGCSRFLHYFFRSDNFSNAVDGISHGTVTRRRTASLVDILNLSFNLPTIDKIRYADNLLSLLDTRINIIRETNATLEAIAQAIFKSWFVDFDPVYAKQQGLTLDFVDEAIAALFPDSFEESEFGLVPKGWKVASFTDIINVIGGGTPKTSISEYWHDGNIPWFSIVDAPISTDVFVINTEKHITEAGLRGSSTKLLPVGTTIISARGTVGRLALTGRAMAMNQSCYGLRGKAGDDYFTYFCTYRLVEILKQRAHGSVFDTITRDTLSGVVTVYPEKSVISAFETLLSPLMERIRENLNQSKILADLRDTLLPRLISGQFHLPEAGTLAEESH
jgi:type I restriction enzyme S subunit